MRFGILGSLEVSTEGGPVVLGGGNQRALLALLLLNAGQEVSRDRLIDELWGEDAPPTAAKIVQNYVSHLRRELGEGDPAGGPLVTTGRGYVLELADGELDVERFEALLEQGQGALTSGDAAQASELLRAALALWRGPPLADFTDHEFAQAAIRRLDERRLVALESRIEADLARGRHAEVMTELRELVESNPLRERLRGQLMLALYRSGRQAEALEVFQDTRRVLAEEVGIEPGAQLKRLQEAMLAQEPSLRPDQAVRLDAPRPPSFQTRRRWLLVGALAALVVGGGVTALLAIGTGDEPPRSALPAGDSVALLNARTGRLVEAVPVGRTPTSVAVGQGAVWALNADERTISRIDPRTRKVETLGVGAVPTDLATGADGLWVGIGSSEEVNTVGAGARRVVRVDPASRNVGAPVRIQAGHIEGRKGAPGQLAVGPRHVWAIDEGAAVSRIDPGSAEPPATVANLNAIAIALDGHSLWALDADGTTVVRVDARTLVVRQRIPIQATRLGAIAAAEGSVWATDSAEGTLWRIDPRPRIVTRTIALEPGVNGVTVGAGAIWATNGVRGTVARVSPQTNRVSHVVALGNTPRDVEVGEGGVWVALTGGPERLPAGSSLATRRGGARPLPGPECRPVFAGDDGAERLIVSDWPLQTSALGGEQITAAIAFVLREHRFRAGEVAVGYQSCDSSTPVAGGSDPGKCASNARAYAGNPSVLGVVGTNESFCASIEIPILNRAPGGPLAMISPSNTEVGLTRTDPAAPRAGSAKLYPKGRNYARLVTPSDVQAAADVLLAQRLGLRRVFLLDDGSPYGYPMALYFRQAARELGLELAGSATWSEGAPRAAMLARRVRRASPDGVFLAGLLGTGGGTVVRALRRELGTEVPLIAPDAFAPVFALYDFSGGTARGMYLSTPGLPAERLPPPGKRVVRELSATQPGAPVSDDAVYAAQAAELLLAAIAESDGTRADVSRRLLESNVDDGIIGKVAFTPEGDVLPRPVTIFRVRGRTGFSRVEDFEGAEVDRVIQVPPAVAP